MADAMTPEQLAIVQHALGRNRHGRREQHASARNHYVAGGNDVQRCRSLVALGYMRERDMHPALTGGAPCFYVTAEGRRAMERESPAPQKLTRSQKRYLAFLDADSGLTFREWLRYG